jgi:hypothetical protein
VSSRANELKRRREGLLAQVAAERRLLADQHARIASGLSRADGWLTVARRVTPAAAIAAIALGIVVGPGRIVRMLQAAAVPAFLIRQLLTSSGEPAISGLRGVLRLFRRGN